MTLVTLVLTTTTASAAPISTNSSSTNLIATTTTATTTTTTDAHTTPALRLIIEKVATKTTKQPTAVKATLPAHRSAFVGAAAPPKRNHIIDVGSGAVYTMVPMAVDGSRLRKRHSKRHSNWYDFNNFNENTTELEWVNPCGGFYVPTTMSMEGGRGVRRKNPKQIYNMLKKSAGNEYKMLKAGQQDIDISNIQIWALHNKTYKFLPKLKQNSTIALKRWYRNIQSYVASFAYLRRIQRAWDMAKLQRENSTARELKLLLFSARRMLCELETAINGTTPALRLQRGFNRLPHVTRNQMYKRLKLYTKRRAERNPKVLQEANTIDLMWVKYYYYEFLEGMWKVLRQKTKRRGQVALLAPHLRSNSNSNSNTNSNAKAFNEVEKHFGSIAATTTADAAHRRHGKSGSGSRRGGGGKRGKRRLAHSNNTDGGNGGGSVANYRRSVSGMSSSWQRYAHKMR